MGSKVGLWSLVWPMDLWCKCLVQFRLFSAAGFTVWCFGPSYSPRAHDEIVWWDLRGLWALVGSTVVGLSLVWPEDSQCRCGLGSLWALVGSAVRVQSLVWPKDLR